MSWTTPKGQEQQIQTFSKAIFRLSTSLYTLPGSPPNYSAHSSNHDSQICISAPDSGCNSGFWPPTRNISLKSLFPSQTWQIRTDPSRILANRGSPGISLVSSLYQHLLHPKPVGNQGLKKQYIEVFKKKALLWGWNLSAITHLLCDFGQSTNLSVP